MRSPRSPLLAFGLGLALVGRAPAESPGMRAELSCRAEARPGRVICELAYTASRGVRLAWVDAVVTVTPEFVRALRSRAIPERHAAADPDARERRLSLAFVATRAGVDSVTVRARAVVCRGRGEHERCRPESHDVHAEIRVGP